MAAYGSPSRTIRCPPPANDPATICAMVRLPVPYSQIGNPQDPRARRGDAANLPALSNRWMGFTDFRIRDPGVLRCRRRTGLDAPTERHAATSEWFATLFRKRFAGTHGVRTGSVVEAWLAMELAPVPEFAPTIPSCTVFETTAASLDMI